MPESTAVINELEKLNNSIEEHINRIIRRIENAPAGSLRIINKGQKHQYYHRIDPSDPQGKYIPRKYHSVAVSLAQKDYDKKLLKILIIPYKIFAKSLLYFKRHIIKIIKTSQRIRNLLFRSAHQPKFFTPFF